MIVYVSRQYSRDCSHCLSGRVTVRTGALLARTHSALHRSVTTDHIHAHYPLDAEERPSDLGWNSQVNNHLPEFIEVLI